MKLKAKIIDQFHIVKNMWLITRGNERTPEAESNAPRSALKNIRMKFMGIAKSSLTALDVLRRYTAAALHLTITIPSIIIIHVGEKFIDGMKSIFWAISNFMNTTNTTTGEPTEVATPDTTITEPNTEAQQVVAIPNVIARNNNSNLLKTLMREHALWSNFPQNATITAATIVADKAIVEPFTETQMVVYKPNLLGFFNSYTRDKKANSQKLLQIVLNKLEQNNSSTVLKTLMREHASWSNSSQNATVTIALTTQTCKHTNEFVKNNEQALVLAGLKILKDTQFLNADSYKGLFKGLFNEINLKEFITNNSNILGSEEKEEKLDYLAAILCVSWALSALAKKSGNDVIRGSYTITKNDAIYKFFLGYVQLVNDNPEPGYVNSGAFAYKRDPQNIVPCSSHYKSHSNQYGIDIRFEDKGEAFELLPHGHKHILFGLIADNSTFIKFEHYGLGKMTEIIRHLIDFSASGKISGVTHREKSVLPAFEQEYKRFCTNIGIVPKAKFVKDMHKEISECINQKSSNIKLASQNDNTEEDAKEWDIVPSQEDIRTDQAKAALNNFKKIAQNNNMSKDSLSVRYGSEVILNFPTAHEIADVESDYKSITFLLRA